MLYKPRLLFLGGVGSRPSRSFNRQGLANSGRFCGTDTRRKYVRREVNRYVVRNLGDIEQAVCQGVVDVEQHKQQQLWKQPAVALFGSGHAQHDR